MTRPEDDSIDPEDPLAELAAESTNESTPAKSLYTDDKTKRTPTRKNVPQKPEALSKKGRRS